MILEGLMDIYILTSWYWVGSGRCWFWKNTLLILYHRSKRLQLVYTRKLIVPRFWFKRFFVVGEYDSCSISRGRLSEQFKLVFADFSLVKRCSIFFGIDTMYTGTFLYARVRTAHSKSFTINWSMMSGVIVAVAIGAEGFSHFDIYFFCWFIV